MTSRQHYCPDSTLLIHAHLTLTKRIHSCHVLDRYNSRSTAFWTTGRSFSLALTSRWSLVEISRLHTSHTKRVSSCRPFWCRASRRKQEYWYHEYTSSCISPQYLTWGCRDMHCACTTSVSYKFTIEYCYFPFAALSMLLLSLTCHRVTRSLKIAALHIAGAGHETMLYSQL